MSYSRQFVEDVSNALPERFYTFFKAYRKKLSILEEDFLDFVQISLEEKLESKASKEKLAPVIRKVKKKFNNRRQYLCTCYMNYADEDIKNPKHPLHFLTVLSPLEFYNRYGNKGIEEVVKDYTDAVLVWRDQSVANRSSDIETEHFFLIDFPVLDFFKNSILLDCFKLDITLAIWKHIEQEMNGDISSYDFSTLEEFMGKPMWPANLFTKQLEQIGEDMFESAVQDDDGQLLLTFQSKEQVKSIMAEDARSIISYLIGLLDESSNTSTERVFEIPLRSLANVLTSSAYNVNSGGLLRVKNVLKYLAGVTFVFNDSVNHKEAIFHILNSVIFTETTSKENVKLEVSSEFFNEVIDRKLISVKKKEYLLLESNLSRTIIHALKREQYIHAKEVGTWFEYTYMFFIFNVYFNKGGKKDHLKMISDSLQEFKDKHIIIEDFVLKRDVFHIKFLPF